MVPHFGEAKSHGGALLASPMLGTCACPLLEVRPSRGLVDEKFQIAVENLPPAHKVTLHSLHQSEDGDFWEAFGFYVSDADGRVTADRHESLGGTYEGVEPMGLLWSLRPVPGSRTGLRLRKKHVASPMVVCISMYEGHVSQRFGELVALACAVTERWYMGPGVRRVDVREGGVTGTLFLPQGPGPFAGVLDMWGGGGGLVEYRAALLASHGFVTMALEYLPADESRTADIEFGYFDAAFKLVQEHPLVARNSVAVLGLSFGTSVALSMAAFSTVVKPRCCVCISGSHVHPINKPILSVFEEIKENFQKTRFDENNYLIWRDVILPLPSEPSMKVDVGRIRCPLLVIVGQDDQNWATVESAEDMQKMMEEAGNSHLLTILSYPGAGHLIEPPYSPHIRASNFVLRGDKVIMLWGGQTKPHADAQEDSWKKILEFLQLHLYHSQDPAPLARL
uniref:Acyl-CoA thioesterase 18 n=1 Tax=Paramormyrops kingsleyae TaxID=1676925 RepID=A0A3B3T2N8_9TELE|nr:acyl-coenzyme A thioesterase 4-like isoform X1 [Paramormyrops kingsleyae]